MKHFEDIWNEAEGVAYKLDENKTPEEVIAWHAKRARRCLDNLVSGVTLPLEDKTQSSILLGETLYHLCAITEKLGLNSAAALRHVIEHKKIELLDPDEDDA